MAKIRYKVRNWRDYDKALKDRFSITLWVNEDAALTWYAEPSGRRGAPRTYTDTAIKCCLTVRTLLRLPLRGCEGFLASLLPLLGLPWLSTPDHSTLCRRGKTLSVELPHIRNGARIDLVVDASGLKICGEGEWKVKVHGTGKRRTWRKLHIGLDAETGEIVAAALTTADVHDSEMLSGLLLGLDGAVKTVTSDGGYDTREDYDAIAGIGAEAVIPPRKGAKIWRHGKRKDPPHARDEILRYIRKHGRRKWKETSGYHRRSLAETVFFRIKTIFGDRLSSRDFDNQATEAFLRLSIMNRMTGLGMPDSYPVAS